MKTRYKTMQGLVLSVILLAPLFIPNIGIISCNTKHPDGYVRGAGTRAESVMLEWLDTQPPATDPGVMASLSLKVTNTGEHTDNYKLEVIGLPDGWTMTWTGFDTVEGPYAYTGDINPDSPSPYTTGILFVTPSSSPMAKADTYTFSVKATSLNYGGSMDQINVQVKVNLIPGVKVYDPPSKTGEPGSNVLYTFTVENTGNGDDRFQLTAEANIANGWGAVLVSSPQTNYIPPGKKIYVQVYHTIPKTALANYSSSLNLYATSLSDSQVKDRGHVETKVKHVYGIELGVNCSFVSVLPEKTYKFKIYVNNTGNGHDNKVTLALGYGPYNMYDWNPVVDNDPLENGILYSGTVTTEFRFRVPISQEEGYYSFTIEAYSGEYGDLFMDSVEIDVYVMPTVGAKIELDPMHTVKYTFSPGYVSYPVRVINSGNTDDTFYLNVTYVSSGLKKGWIYFSENNISLAPAEEKEITVTVNLPEKVLAKNYTIEISAESYMDPGVGTAKARIYLHVWAEYGIDLWINESEIEKTINPSAGELAKKTVKYEYYLKNLGNDPSKEDQFVVDVVGSFDGWNAWKLQYAERVSAGPFDTEKLILSITPPSKVSVGEYEFVISAKSIMDPTKVDDIKVLVKIVQYDFAVSSQVKYNGKPWSLFRYEVNKKILVEVLIQNKGNSYVGKNGDIPSLDVLVIAGTGPGAKIVYNGTITDLKPFGTASIIFEWTMSSRGRYNLTVTVDPYNKIEESDEDNNVLITPDVEFYTISKTGSKSKGEGFVISGESMALIVIIILEVLMTLYLYTINRRKKLKQKLLEEAYREKGEEKLELSLEEQLEEKGMKIEKPSPGIQPMPASDVSVGMGGMGTPQYSPYQTGEINLYMGGGYNIQPKPVPSPIPSATRMPLPPMQPVSRGTIQGIQKPRPTIKITPKTPITKDTSSAVGGELRSALMEAKKVIPQADSKEKGLKDVLKDVKKTETYGTSPQSKVGGEKKDLKSLLQEIKSS